MELHSEDQERFARLDRDVQPRRFDSPKFVRNQKANPHEQHLLRFVGEQYAVRVSQLSRFSGQPVAEIERIVEDWKSRGLVRAKQFITGDEVWVWLRLAGTRLAGVTRHRGVHYRQFAQLGAVTDARLWLEENYDVREWFSERHLRHERKKKDHGWGGFPDGVARIAMDEDGEAKEHFVAIETQVGYLTSIELKRKLAAYPARFGGILYFAVPAECRRIESLGVLKENPRLAIREIAPVHSTLDNPAWRLPGDPIARRSRCKAAFLESLSELDLDVLDLLAEQGAIPMDQLIRFLLAMEAEMDEAKIEALVSRLVQGRAVRRAKPLVDEPPWLWLAEPGRLASRLDLPVSLPKLGGLELKRGINEARLQTAAGRDDVKWICAKALRVETGTTKAVPHGVIVTGSKRVAVEVFVWLGNVKRLREKWGLRSKEDYDGVLWFYGRQSRSRILTFMEKTNAPNLGVYPLPGAELPSTSDSDGDSKPRRLKGPFSKRIKRRPDVVREAFVEDLPDTGLEAVAVAAGLKQLPKVERLWRRVGTGARVYYVKIAVGIYRVSNSGYGWDAREILDESVFVEEATSHTDAIMTARVRREAGLPVRHETSDEVWSKVEAAIPSPKEYVKGSRKRRVSDRAVVSGAIFIVRNKLPWTLLSSELGYGNWGTCQRRIKEWQDVGALDGIVEALEEALEDGKQLDWPWLTTSRCNRTRKK